MFAPVAAAAFGCLNFHLENFYVSPQFFLPFFACTANLVYSDGGFALKKHYYKSCLLVMHSGFIKNNFSVHERGKRTVTLENGNTLACGSAFMGRLTFFNTSGIKIRGT